MSFALLFQVSYDPSPMPYIVSALLLIAAGFGFWKFRRRREEALRLMATKLGLQWLGGVLPPDFPRKLLDELYTGWAVPRWSSPHNVIGASAGEDYLLAFDIKVAKNDSSYERTIVARRSRTATVKNVFARGYVYRCHGEWHMATLNSAVMIMPRLIEPAMIEKLRDQLS